MERYTADSYQNRAGVLWKYLRTITGTFQNQSTYVQVGYNQFWENVLKYIISTLKMYLSTTKGTFQSPIKCWFPENQTTVLP